MPAQRRERRERQTMRPVTVQEPAPKPSFSEDEERFFREGEQLAEVVQNDNND